MFEIIKSIGYLQRLLLKDYRMKVYEYEEEIEVLVYDGYEALTEIAEKAKEKVKVIFDDGIGEHKAFVKANGITFYTYLRPSEIKKYVTEEYRYGTSNDQTNPNVWISRERKRAFILRLLRFSGLRR